MCVFKYHAFIYFLRPPPWSGTIYTIPLSTVPIYRHIPSSTVSSYLRILILYCIPLPTASVKIKYPSVRGIFLCAMPICFQNQSFPCPYSYRMHLCTVYRWQQYIYSTFYLKYPSVYISVYLKHLFMFTVHQSAVAIYHQYSSALSLIRVRLSLMSIYLSKVYGWRLSVVSDYL